MKKTNRRSFPVISNSMTARPVILACIVSLLLGACASVPRKPDPSEPFTLVAFGDSTTAPREVDGKPLRVYANVIQEDLVRRGVHGTVINAGVGGNNTDQARARFETDVLAHDPDLVIIQFGLNDSCIDLWDGRDRPRISRETYAANLRFFVEALRKRDCDVILMTANPMRWTEPLLKLYGSAPYDVNDPWGFNLTNREYGEAVRTLASDLDVPLIDVYQGFYDYGNVAGQAAEDLLLDGMHPNDRGHAMIAEWLLKEMAKLRRVH
jgi:lysophospholipase L1-like esterase